MSTRIHSTAIIEDNVQIGNGTSVWDNVHIRRDAVVGESCIIGGKTYVAYGVKIGDRVKINANVYICHGVIIEDGVMVGAGCVFTNDLFPRATTPDLTRLLSSSPNEQTGETRVREGASIGAHATLGNDIEIGRFAMVGMGAVVTRSVADFALVHGNPARLAGFVCRCGPPLIRIAPGVQHKPLTSEVRCSRCRRAYRLTDGHLTES